MNSSPAPDADRDRPLGLNPFYAPFMRSFRQRPFVQRQQLSTSTLARGSEEDVNRPVPGQLFETILR